VPTFILSLKVSFRAVSGAIFTTLAPLPLKNARNVPAQVCSKISGVSCCSCCKFHASLVLSGQTYSTSTAQAKC
jgi:hypothetical protein